ncbi:MAG TPA: RNA polymerase sigma factor [Pyrinomonadaceae bacterium]|jgi:RNA polymerase sigma-70 factor (ECF subfamily)
MMSQATTLAEPNPAWPAMGAETAPTEVSQFDYQLAQRIAGGDMLAFEELYQRYHRRVYSLCLRMTNQGAEAEDLMQEIFIHVYRKIGSFRGESTMMTWLYRVTVNKVLMHFRKNSVRRERTTEDGETPEPLAEMTQARSHPPVLERLALERAIEQLAPGYRAVFILHDVEGYEHAEIARICGNSVGTSKSQLHKARKKLYELLKETNRA